MQFFLSDGVITRSTLEKIWRCFLTRNSMNILNTQYSILNSRYSIVDSQRLGIVPIIEPLFFSCVPPYSYLSTIIFGLFSLFVMRALCQLVCSYILLNKIPKNIID
jgi:hypothetical protein